MIVKFYGDAMMSNLIHLPPGYHPASAHAEGEVKRLVARGVERGDVLGYLEGDEPEYFGTFERRDGGGTDLAFWLSEFTRNRRDALERC